MYKTKGNLNRHLQYECGREPTLQCPLCEVQTKHKSSMKRHIENRHPGYECAFIETLQ